MVTLHEKYAAQGFQIFAFPCNQFGGQESGTPEQIAKFVAKRGVKFQMMAKCDVNGEKESDVYTFLKVRFGRLRKVPPPANNPLPRVSPSLTPLAVVSQGRTGGQPPITWNFGVYYLVDKKGDVTGHATNPAALDGLVAAALV